MDWGHDDEPEDEKEGPPRKIRKEALTPAGSSGTYARQRAWIQRSDPKTHGNSWRPRPLYRCSAKRCLDMLDNQLQWSTSWERGLFHLKPGPTLEMWLNWRTWPHVDVVEDLGSDILSACHAGQHKFELNFGKRPDPAHGGTCDFDVTLKQSQLKGFWCVMAISWNLRHGLDAEETRNMQVLDTMDACFREFDHTLPLFVASVQDLHVMFRNMGYEFDESLGAEPLDSQLWQLCKQ